MILHRSSFEKHIKKSSKRSNNSFLPSRTNVVVDTGFSIVAAYGGAESQFQQWPQLDVWWILFENDFWFLGVCSTIGGMLSCDFCIDRFWRWCDGGSGGVWICPLRTSMIRFYWVLRPLTMWLMCGCRSNCVLGTDISFTSSGISFQVSSFVTNKWHIKCFIVSGYVFKKGKNPNVSPTFWVHCDNDCIMNRGCVYWRNC